MDIKDFLMLETLIVEQSITKTAEIIGMSQPGVTLRLSKMRDHLKDPILVRQGNNMVITKKAKFILSKLHTITQDIEYLMPRNEQFNPSDATPSKFVIYITEMAFSMVAETLINTIHRYNKQHEILIYSFPTMYEGESNYQFDHADIIIGIHHKLPNFAIETILEDDLVVAYDQYPMPEGDLTYEDYLKLPSITYNIQEEFNHFIVKHLGLPDPRNIKIKCSLIEMCRQLLKDRYVIVLTRIFADFVGLNYVKLPFKTDKISTTIAYPERLKHNAKNQWLRALCKEQCIRVSQNSSPHPIKFKHPNA